MLKPLAVSLLVLSAFLAGPALAFAASGDHLVSPAAHAFQEGEGEGHDTASSERRDGLNDTVIWSIVGLGAFAAIFGALYFFKREVGGFPENPSWVAPITIMPSKDFPDEGDFGEQPPSAHALAEH